MRAATRSMAYKYLVERLVVGRCMYVWPGMAVITAQHWAKVVGEDMASPRTMPPAEGGGAATSGVVRN